MPVFLIPPAVVAIGAALTALSLSAVGKPLIENIVKSYKKDLEEWALSHAFAAIGIPLTTETGFSREAVTAAINAGPLAGSGVVLTDVFDREAIKSDVKRIALEKAVAETGLEIKGLTVPDLRAALKAYVSNVAREQLESGDGDIVAAAPALVEMLRMIREANKSDPAGPGGTPGYHPGPAVPVDPSPEAEKNRERQARYRGAHTRHWEPIEGGVFE